MRKALRNRVYMIIFSLLLINGCSNKDEHAHQETTRYTCPMHPQIVTNEPGICPICKMDLVPLSGHGQVTASDSLKYLVKPTNQQIQASITTVKPQSGNRFGQEIIRGVINYDGNNWKSISSRVSGRIERLYVKYNYQAVSKGQKIMDIYSPDLANAQQELLFLKQNSEPELLEAAKRKLRLFGITDQQIAATLRSGKVDYTTSIYSHYSGYLSEGNLSKFGSSNSQAGGTMITTANDPTGATGMGGGGAMSGSPGSSASSVPAIDSAGPLSIREGEYVSAGQKLFDLINTSSVWAEFYLRPEQLNMVTRGTEVEITAADNASEKAKAKVSLVQPYYNEGSNFTVARILLNNPDKVWRIGQLVNVGTLSKGVNGTWIPRKSVLEMGGKYVVFIKQTGGFKPAYVEVVNKIGDWVDIGKSLSSATELAANAWFLVDSESFVKPDSIEQ